MIEPQMSQCLRQLLPTLLSLYPPRVERSGRQCWELLQLGMVGQDVYGWLFREGPACRRAARNENCDFCFPALLHASCFGERRLSEFNVQELAKQ